MFKPLMKAAAFTDIHFGKKANSKTHNEDCVRFVEWFCSEVRKDPEIDHIIFLGDWNENRSSLNIQTLHYSYQAARLLDRLGLPVFFIVGNHDLYHRHTREIHSVIPFEEFENFHVINEPTIVERIGNGGALICPYMFHDEYPSLAKHLKYETWWGHFEFKGFMVTGYGMAMPTGPDATDFKGPKHIFSGHFHKRQADEQVAYIGNTFPMDFGDAGDFERGMMTYNHHNDEALFYNWEDCPKYIKTTLSDLLDKTVKLYEQSRVKCVVDIPISFEESTYLKQKFTEDYNLREFTLEETSDIKDVMTDTECTIDWDDTEIKGVDDLVMQMLEEIESEHIDNQRLKDIYQTLK